MSRASKPVDLQSSHLTKKEYDERKQEEQRLKGNNDKVYRTPRHLSKEGKKLYRFIVKELKESNILNNLDITILETCVDAILRMKMCNEEIDKLGILVTGAMGGYVKNPAITAYKDYNAIFNKCCMELGLSPSARAKISVLNVKTQENNNDALIKALRGEDV